MTASTEQNVDQIQFRWRLHRQYDQTFHRSSARPPRRSFWLRRRTLWMWTMIVRSVEKTLRCCVELHVTLPPAQVSVLKFWTLHLILMFALFLINCIDGIPCGFFSCGSYDCSHRSVRSISFWPSPQPLIWIGYNNNRYSFIMLLNEIIKKNSSFKDKI